MGDPQVEKGTLVGGIAATQMQQRRFSRANVDIAAQYERENRRDERREGRVVNLGGGGLRLSSSEDLPTNSVLTMHFTIPEGGIEVTARGKVVLSFFNAVENCFAHGLAFTQIDPVDQRAIIDYVEGVQPSV